LKKKEGGGAYSRGVSISPREGAGSLRRVSFGKGRRKKKKRAFVVRSRTRSGFVRPRTGSSRKEKDQRKRGEGNRSKSFKLLPRGEKTSDCTAAKGSGQAIYKGLRIIIMKFVKRKTAREPTQRATKGFLITSTPAC